MGKNHGLESSCAGRRKDTLAVLVCIKKGAQTLPLLAAARKGSNLRWIEYFPANLDSKGFFLPTAYHCLSPFFRPRLGLPAIPRGLSPVETNGRWRQTTGDIIRTREFKIFNDEQTWRFIIQLIHCLNNFMHTAVGI